MRVIPTLVRREISDESCREVAVGKIQVGAYGALSDRFELR